MKALKIFTTITLGASLALSVNAQTLKWEDHELEINNVNASLIELDGSKVLKVERDLNRLPFDTARVVNTVDEPTFLKIKGLNLRNGVIEVKVLSKLQNPNPFAQAQGFIGLAFRINEENTAFESIYLRPRAARADNQFARNHSVQYYAYPDYKFLRLRQEEFKGQYETYADIGLDEWITMRIEFAGKKAILYLNNQKYPSFIVNDMKGSTDTGSIGLWVDIGTEGYFKDLKITEKLN